MDTQMLIRIVVVVLMLAVVGVFALKRVLFLTSLIRSGAKTSVENNRKDDLGKRITTQVEEVFGQTRLLRWSIPGLAHFFTMWGFFVLGSVYVEAFGQVVDHDFHIPIIGRWGVLGFLQDFFAVAVLARHHHVRDHSHRSRAQKARPRLPLLRLAHRRRMADPLHDLQRHLDLRAGQGSRREHRGPALRQWRVLLPLHGRDPAPVRRTRQRVDRDAGAARTHRRHADLPVDRAALQAPAHRPRAAQRHVQAAAQRPRPVAARRVQRRADRLRGSRRGRRARPGQDRGLHLEGLPRLHHVHRVRPLPVAVPGVEHR